VSLQRYSVMPGLFLAVPLTSTDRSLRHHVAVPADEDTGLARASYAMSCIRYPVALILEQGVLAP
jgi:hypothetical protein